jgi:hypothetical protein
MTMTLHLDTMTIADKLQAMEVIWVDLVRSAKQVPSPAWHSDVLRARELRIQEGKSHYTDWADAKRRIREQTQ